MTTFTLRAEPRELIGKKAQKLREQNLIPAVLYGHNIKNQNLAVKKNDFFKVYSQVGESSLINLQINEAKPIKTLIHDLQLDPVNDEIIHVDFYQVREDEKIKANLKLEFEGEAPAVKELGGVLVKNIDEVEIECLPKDLELLKEIKVNLMGLKNFNDAIHIKELSIPAGIKILTSPDEVVALITEIQEEKIEEIKPVAEVEVVAKAKEGEKEETEEKAVEEAPKQEANKK